MLPRSGLACVARKQLKREETSPWTSSAPCRLLRGLTDLLHGGQEGWLLLCLGTRDLGDVWGVCFLLIVG